MNRPNILYIHSHDTGRYVQPYGHAIPTPNLQALAESGVLFRQAFCAAPTCSPSRAALLTGQCPHSSGMMGLAHRGWKLNDYSQHIIHTLKRHDYTSVLCGVQHLAEPTKTAPTEIIGYDLRLDPPSSRAMDVAQTVAAWLENTPEEPFFLDVGFYETHVTAGDSLFGHGEGDARYVLPPAPLPDTPETRRDMAGYKLAAKALDEAIGVVFSALEAHGLADNTLVICTTDHGIALPLMKCNLTDHGTGVLLILRGPEQLWGGTFCGGRVVDAMVSHLDVFPTVCELLTIEKPTWLQGASLFPLLNGTSDEIHDELFAEVTYHAAYQPMRSVRTKRWKYIRQFSDRATPVLTNCDDSTSKDLLVEQGWRERLVPQEQLFDLLFDPGESCNLVLDERHRPILEELRSRLYNWMQTTGDPLLHGPVPLPPGTVEKDTDDVSPSYTGREYRPTTSWPKSATKVPLVQSPLAQNNAHQTHTTHV